jgi:lipoprotein NlpD
MHVQTSLLRIGTAAIATAALMACTTPPPRLPPPPPSANGGFSPLPPITQPTPSAPAPKPQAIFIRPAGGRTIASFDERNKGIDIAGSMGEPVVAAADGRVVYVGGELRGYGNMVIVKHNETFLTAYAHAQRILVKEKDVVRQGQVIAEMGNSDADRVKLHFEIRKQGVAVDPEPYLSGQLR